MLASHPKVAFASDPFAPVFKEFRNAVAERAFGRGNLDPEAPLDDYYFFPRKQELLTAVQGTGLDLSTAGRDLTALRERVRRQARTYAPKVEPHLDGLAGESFGHLIQEGLRVVRTAYGGEGTEVVGFKEVWTGEFAAHLLAAFPEARVICMLRDPRGVCASKNAKDEKYPWLFLGRQWRKLAAFAWLVGHGDAAGRVFLLRYEDLVKEPEATVRSLTEFIGVEFVPELLDPTRFRDGGGASWAQNSSYFQDVRAFNARSVEKWRDVLSEEEIAHVEGLCWPEMALFGYTPERFDPYAGDPATVFAPPMLDEASLPRWIRPYGPADLGGLIREMACEYVRTQAILRDAVLGPDDKRRFCLSELLFNHLQATHGEPTDAPSRAVR